MQNHLKNQTSPYLLQHVNNPVDWYPWCEEAFERAKEEDKPIFLSIGYSTCHWCHVMAHESFEDRQVAEILNEHFISIKVDREERPDIDQIYMAVCQAFTGSGGWPTTLFLTPDQKPFFAGTYFPKTARYGQMGLMELLKIVYKKWKTDRGSLLDSAEEILSVLKRQEKKDGAVEGKMIEGAVDIFKKSFDSRYGGFGEAPKFPTPHNLLFLMQNYEKHKDENTLKMVEKTLLQMYRGAMFDHVGGGFSRYSTDRYFLVPHFEKMLYDNALLILAYCKAYEITKKQIYQEIARKTADYIFWEMTSAEGGFYSAQDADSEGEEGKYYVFKPAEIIKLLGEQTGRAFNEYFNITESGNFEGKSIPNLLKTEHIERYFDEALKVIYKYRKARYELHLDDKILTSWNSLMIAAMCQLYRVTEDERYLDAAKKAENFIEEKLCENETLYVSYRKGQKSQKGFLDDYANQIFALLALYEATLECEYLKKAKKLCEKVVLDFQDEKNGGFFLSGKENEKLVLQPKETYDGAVFSGNSAMAYNLVRLWYITGEKMFEELAEQQLRFMSNEAEHYPAGYSMFLVALSDFLEAPEKITVVVKDRQDVEGLPCKISLSAVVNVLTEPTKEYPFKNDRTTFYICKGHTCLPPVNEL